MPKSLRIADIQTTEILYYDPHHENICLKFCNHRDIDCLPAIGSPKTIYTLDKTGQCFVMETVDSDRIVDPSEPIFSEATLEKFRAHKLLFVYNRSELLGVAHFSDYAKSTVSIYLYKLLFDYEKSLRELLAIQGYNNESMLQYCRKESQKASGNNKQYWKGLIKRFETHREQNEKLPPFQSFYLRQLIGLANDVGIELDCSRVGDLRNSIAHAHELVQREDHSANDLVYNFDSFEEFCIGAIQLLTDLRKVHNLSLLHDAKL